MGGVPPDARTAVGILDVLGVDLCLRALLDLVPVEDLVRSERVCKRWQAAVLNYLCGSRLSATLGFRGIYKHSYSYFFPEIVKRRSRIMIIDYDQYSLPFLSKILGKWGNYITTAIMTLPEETYLDLIASKCPNLHEIEIVLLRSYQGCPLLNQVQNLKHLKQITLLEFYVLSKNRPSDLVFGELLQDKHYENISIKYNYDLSGLFLKSLKPDYLKSLSLLQCRQLSILDLCSALHDKRNLINLELEVTGNMRLNDVGLLLKKMPQLEDLRLIYMCNDLPLSEEFIEAFSSLVKLKRLIMCGNDNGVNDAFLKALAEGCSELEYFEVQERKHNVTARGVAALCRRSPSAVTTLDFSGFKNKDRLLEKMLVRFRRAPLYQELAALGCLELTLEWFLDAVYDPRGRRLALNQGPGGSKAQTGDLQKELKMFIL